MPKPIKQQIGSIALLVENYDSAIEFYTRKLGFAAIESVKNQL